MLKSYFTPSLSLSLSLSLSHTHTHTVIIFIRYTYNINTDIVQCVFLLNLCGFSYVFVAFVEGIFD